mmetsp:Transcript_55496/g.171955  ORF Transcript_55496/g.171955 Transcript_55496/m.171955 type:complete len:85 (-) Transcript_55496:164-418(-)
MEGVCLLARNPIKVGIVTMISSARKSKPASALEAPLLRETHEVHLYMRPTWGERKERFRGRPFTELEGLEMWQLLFRGLLQVSG